MAVDLQKVAEEKGIKYFLVSFVCMHGALRAKLVPAQAIGRVQENGAGFAGFAGGLDMSPADPDVLGKPDPDSLIQLPWKPEVGWLASDMWMNGKAVENTPRVLLKRQIAAAAERGYTMKSGVECEFHLVTQDGKALGDPLDNSGKPCYDQAALMRQYDLVKEACDSMFQLGWGPYQNDHEDANGQFELNWDYDDCLKTADRHVFFKYMLKNIAERHGMRATFMPKPFLELTGNGCHAHVSLWDKSGKTNLFGDERDDLGLSKLGYHFLGGIMHSAEALCSIFTPTVNSFKRLNAPRTLSGSTWSPNSITYSGDNRTHMVRIPDGKRIELRTMDGAANPYLMQAGILAAGLDGIDNQRDPGERLDINMYTDGHKLENVRRLPLNLLDAIRITDKSEILRARLGDAFIDSYVKMKLEEWKSYMQHLSAWEITNALDC